MRLIDPNHPFFARVWVRWVSALVPVVWGVLEFVWIGNPMWGVLFLALGAFAFWELVIRGPDQG